jgi:hypothetical protein
MPGLVPVTSALPSPAIATRRKRVVTPPTAAPTAAPAPTVIRGKAVRKAVRRAFRGKVVRKATASGATPVKLDKSGNPEKDLSKEFTTN